MLFVCYSKGVGIVGEDNDIVFGVIVICIFDIGKVIGFFVYIFEFEVRCLFVNGNVFCMLRYCFGFRFCFGGFCCFGIGGLFFFGFSSIVISG